MVRIGPKEARAIVQQEIEQLGTRQAELAITRGILIAKDGMAPKGAAAAPGENPRTDAMTAQWQAFTQALGKYAQQADQNSAKLGGREGVTKELDRVAAAQAGLKEILQPERSGGTFKPEIQEAIDVVGRFQYLKRDAISPRGLEATRVLVEPYEQQLAGAKFDAVFHKGAPLAEVFAEPPPPMPSLGKNSLASYMRGLASSIESGALKLMTSMNRAPSPNEFATVLRMFANRVDPDYKPRRGDPYEPKNPFDGSLGHLTIGLHRKDPVVQWLKGLDWGQLVDGQRSIKELSATSA
jgi:hypothetical protein